MTDGQDRMQPTDAELISAWTKRGDAEAFHALYDRHARTVYGFAYGTVGNGHLADEVVQETFLKASRQARGYQGRAAFSTWLLSIARNVAADVGRKETRRGRDVEREAPLRHEPPPHEALENEERRQRVREAIHALPEAQRVAITLCSLQGLGIAEAAEVLGWPEGSVKSTLHRAREALREKLKDLEPGC